MTRLELKPDLAQQFLTALYSPYYFQAKGRGYLEIRGRKETDPLGKMPFNRFYPGIPSLLKDMEKWENKRNYWIGVAPRKSSKGGKKGDCLALTALYSDIDYGQEGHRKKNKWQTKSEALATIQTFPLPPSILIHSGGGFQVYWLLREPIVLENGNYGQAEAIMKGLNLALGGDVGTQDISRILRLPGTLNMKLAGNPRPVEIVWCEPERLYCLADFSKYATTQGRNQRYKEKGRGEAPISPQPPEITTLNVPDWTKTLILTGAKEGYPSRSERDHAVIGELIRAGCILDSIETIFQTYAVGDKYREKGSQGRTYLQASIDKILPFTQESKNQAQHIGKVIPLWPQEVMTGAAGLFAESYTAYLETPGPFLFMNYLTLLGHLISDKITLHSETNPQPRLYAVNLGESADTRKTTSINKTANFFQEVIDPGAINPIWGVGSAEGLAKAFDKNPRVILLLDELKAIVQKMRIEGSVLLPCINTLFELNHYHNLTKNHDLKIDGAELCLLAASTLGTYQNMFTSHFLDIGFINRLFIVIGDSERKFSIPPSMPANVKESLKHDLHEVLRYAGKLSKAGRYAVPIDPQAKKIFDDWYFNFEGSIFTKRLDAYGHRLMPLLAVNEMKPSITPAIAERTVALLNYQLEARKFADPIDADNAIARLEEKIRRLLFDGPRLKRDLEKHAHKNRVGSSLWNTAIRNLKIRIYSKPQVCELPPE